MNVHNKLVLSLAFGKHFQPSLMLAGKAGAYPSEAAYRFSDSKKLNFGELKNVLFLCNN
jgi:hypothetical protein